MIMHKKLVSAPQSMLFDAVKDAYGTRLALVFGNEYLNGMCPFYNSQCYHCDIGKGEGLQFSHIMNMNRIKFFESYYRSVLPKVVHLIIYNSGSTLNRQEMSKKTLDAILTFIRTIEKCRIVSFDSREVFITENKLSHILKGLRHDQKMRVVLGVESQSDDVRIGKLYKKMSKRSIDKAFNIIAKFGGQIGIDFNIVFRPPELTRREAIRDACMTVEYGLRLSDKYKVPIDFNLHPYYRSSAAISKYPNHPNADIKDALNTALQLKKMLKSVNSTSMLFIGCQNEGHDDKRLRKGKTTLGSASKINKINSSMA